MSKGIVRRKIDSSIGDRFSDNEANRRRPCHQLIEKEKQRKFLALNDIRKNQLGILQEILFNERNVNINKSEKFIPKNNTIRNRKNHTTRPTSAKNINSSDWNQSEEDNQSVVENEPVRLSRSNKKDDQQHRMTRQHSNGVRSMNNVSFISDKSKSDKKSNGIETDMNASPGQFKKLLVRLSSELNNLELITGFKSNKNDISSSTCSTALAAALTELVGHVKQCASNSKEINNFKDQLSIVIKTQLNFQEKIENQIATLQTMMQTICQLVNKEIISNKKFHQNQTDFEIIEPHQNWLNNAQRPYLIAKDTSNAMDELLMFTRQMNNASPIDANLYYSPSNNRHSAYLETLEASKRLTRSTSSISTNGIEQHRNSDQVSRSSMISPNDIPLFESALPNGNSSASIPQIGGTSTTEPSASPTETILEKILRERLRLVEQMAELTKQHETTQEELANLEAKTIQSLTT